MPKKSAKSSLRPMTDAISLLKEDHKKVKRLLNELEDAESDQRKGLLDEIESEIKVHMRIEEEIFYPAFKEAVRYEDDKQLFFEAYSAQILFFGAEFTQVYARLHGTQVVPKKNAEMGNPKRETELLPKTGTTPNKPIEREETRTPHRRPILRSCALLGIAVAVSLLPHRDKHSNKVT